MFDSYIAICPLSRPQSYSFIYFKINTGSLTNDYGMLLIIAKWLLTLKYATKAYISIASHTIKTINCGLKVIKLELVHYN